MKCGFVLPESAVAQSLRNLTPSSSEKKKKKPKIPLTEQSCFESAADLCKHLTLYFSLWVNSFFFFFFCCCRRPPRGGQTSRSVTKTHPETGRYLPASPRLWTLRFGGENMNSVACLKWLTMTSLSCGCMPCSCRSGHTAGSYQDAHRTHLCFQLACFLGNLLGSAQHTFHFHHCSDELSSSLSHTPSLPPTSNTFSTFPNTDKAAQHHISLKGIPHSSILIFYNTQTHTYISTPLSSKATIHSCSRVPFKR